MGRELEEKKETVLLAAGLHTREGWGSSQPPPALTACAGLYWQEGSQWDEGRESSPHCGSGKTTLGDWAHSRVPSDRMAATRWSEFSARALSWAGDGHGLCKERLGDCGSAAPTRAGWARSSLSSPQLPHGGQGEDGARALSEAPGSRMRGVRDAAPSTRLGQTLPPAGISPQPPASPSPLSALILLMAAGSPGWTQCSLQAKAMQN